MKSILLVAVAIFSPICQTTPLNERSSNYISSCGSTWMARDDVESNHGEISRRGYLSAVSAFCQLGDGHSVEAGGYLSMATRVFLDGGGDSTSNGVPGYVYFEIRNKQTQVHLVTMANCQSYLQQLSNDNSKCWGSNHHDTKGGTWQVGSDAISYHGLGQSVPPAQDAIDKIFTNGALTVLTGSGGAALSPFPLTSTADITPVACHSHNDYTRTTPLYDALSAGCISVEADVWLHGSNLRVAHTDPGDSGPTIQDLYVNPLKALLDAQNVRITGAKNGVYPMHSDQTLTLLIDFKSDGATTWDAVIVALRPLGDAGYLSYWSGSNFVQGPITIVASGNAPLYKAQNAATNPGFAVFMDAPVSGSLDTYNTSNTFYASADFETAITSSTASPLSTANLSKLRNQVSAGHAKGFKIRYWDIPSTGLWQQLVDEGVDILNVDDLYAVSGVDWHI